jgi:autotransporter-associated beta strand protein
MPRWLVVTLAVLTNWSARPIAAQTWVGPGTDWNSPTNWSPATVPNSPSAIANFTGAALGPVNLSNSAQVQSMSFSNPMGGYTIGRTASVSLRVNAINVGSGVTGNQTIDLPFLSSGSLTVTNNSSAPGTTLTFGSNVLFGVADVPGGLIVNGTGITNFVGSMIPVGQLFEVAGGVTVNGGTLILSNASNGYGGGTIINGGTLQLGTGTAIPTGSNVFVGSGAQFNIGPFSNGSSAAIGTVSLNGGTFRVPSGSGDYYLNRLDMTGGALDFTGTNNFWMHFTGAGAGITTFAGTTNWTGSNISRIQNDTSSPLQVTLHGGAMLNAGIILSSGGSNPNFNFSGGGTVRLSNPANTANITVNDAYAITNDLSTNLGSGAFGTLGAGSITLSSGFLRYDGPTATSAKPLTMFIGGGILLDSPGINLTMNGVIGQSTPSGFTVRGPAPGGQSTLTLTANNTYSGTTVVYGGATLAIPTITNGGIASPIGSSSGSGSLLLGHPTAGRGELLLTGANPNYTTNRGATIQGTFASGSGGTIGVQNAGTTLTWVGSIVENAGTPASFIKTGAGNLELASNGNSYIGGTYIEGGTLTVYIGNPFGVPGSAGVLPDGGNVTVNTGTTLLLRGFNGDYNLGNEIGAIRLAGGTLRVANIDSSYYGFNQLDMTGGAVDLTGTGTFSLVFKGTGAGINVNPSSATASTVGSAGRRFVNATSGPLPITVAAGSTGSGIDLDAGNIFSRDNILGVGIEFVIANPTFVKRGAGTMRLTNLGNTADFVVQQGALRVDDITTGGTGAFGTGNLTLDGGRLAWVGANATLTKPFTTGMFGGTLDIVNAGTTLTVTSPIISDGPLIKSGPGVLILDNTLNPYGGGIKVNAGRLDVGNDNQLGQATVTVNPLGTLRYTASTSTARTFNLFNGTMELSSGATLTMNGATVGGGFLRGTGTYNLTGNASLTGVTTFTNTNLNVTGPASITNFAHNGNLTVNSGQTLSMNYGANGSAGRITVHGTMNVTEFVSNGFLSVPAGGLINNTGSNMVLGGGSRTFVGSVANPGGKIDLGGQQLLVAGGLLVTNGGSFGSGNGVRNGTTVADFGALVKGTGPYESVITQNGGQYLPGNSPGTSQVGTFNLNGGGGLIFQITDAGPSVTFPTAPGVAGMNPGWGLTQVFTALNFTATPASPFTITMQTQLPPPAAPDTPGLMSSFDPNQGYQWLIFDLQPGAAFNGTFDPNAINFATSQFVNATLGGSFSLARNGGQIFLTFTPVPEPALVLGVAFGGLVICRAFRRRSV